MATVKKMIAKFLRHNLLYNFQPRRATAQPAILHVMNRVVLFLAIFVCLVSVSLWATACFHLGALTAMLIFVSIVLSFCVLFWVTPASANTELPSEATQYQTWLSRLVALCRSRAHDSLENRAVVNYLSQISPNDPVVVNFSSYPHNGNARAVVIDIVDSHTKYVKAF
jgi:ABC-type transport system involved in cytochrome bd biosynthesis fused ATPase/permease subunit